VGATYGVPAGGITTVMVNGDARVVPPGPLGAEFKVSGGSGGFLAYTVGRTADALFAAEDIGAPAS
jgi:hypothetical protein